MSTDNTTQAFEEITVLPKVYVIPREDEEGVTASELYGTTVAVSEVIKTSVMGSVLNEIEPAERWKVINAVGNAKVGGLAGIGISVAEDGAVGLSSAGVLGVAGLNK